MALRRNQIRNAFYLLMTAQGTPCILAGDEFYNSQKGNNNVYCQDNEIGWVNWSRLKTDDSLFRYVKSLIEFRKKHQCLHRKEELQGVDRAACGVPDVSYHGENAWQVKTEVSSRQLGVLYAGSDVDDDECFVAYNMHWIPHVYALPSPGRNKKWLLAADTERGILRRPKNWKTRRGLSSKKEASPFWSVRRRKKTLPVRKGEKKAVRRKNEGIRAFSYNYKT